ncbi:MAG: adenosine deaminase [Rhodoferax sp.]
MSDRFTTLPKAEVHVHLEGTFDAGTLAQWAQQAGRPLPRPVAQLFQFQGLGDFLEFLDLACSLVDSAQRLETLAYTFCQRLAQDGTGYADLIINPSHWKHWHGRLRTLLDALDSGFRAAEADGLPPVGLCVSLLRQQSADQALELVDLLGQWRHPRVVALSVDGNEALAGRTGARFAPAFARAAQQGLRRTVHAGESSGPEGVWDALQLLQADRIDHGVRAIEDPALVEELARRGTPLGICPTSNTVLGLYPRLAEHPLERLRQAGVRLSLNTDDPSLLGTRLPQEYAHCAAQFGWGDAQVRAVAATSFNF